MLVTNLPTLVTSLGARLLRPLLCIRNKSQDIMMKTSQKGIDLIKEFEGFRATAYRCPAGRWTIGYGHTASAYEGMQITREQAEKLLKGDIAEAEAVVEEACPVLTQNRFDALVSFVFNVGRGNFLRSTLLKCVKANPDNLDIRDEFMRWNKSKGMVLAGLMRRRRAECNLYFAS